MCPSFTPIITIALPCTNSPLSFFPPPTFAFLPLLLHLFLRLLLPFPGPNLAESARTMRAGGSASYAVREMQGKMADFVCELRALHCWVCVVEVTFLPPILRAALLRIPLLSPRSLARPFFRILRRFFLRLSFFLLFLAEQAQEGSQASARFCFYFRRSNGSGFTYACMRRNPGWGRLFARCIFVMSIFG